MFSLNGDLCNYRLSGLLRIETLNSIRPVQLGDEHLMKLQHHCCCHVEAQRIYLQEQMMLSNEHTVQSPIASLTHRTPRKEWTG